MSDGNGEDEYAAAYSPARGKIARQMLLDFEVWQKLANRPCPRARASSPSTFIEGSMRGVVRTFGRRGPSGGPAALWRDGDNRRGASAVVQRDVGILSPLASVPVVVTSGLPSAAKTFFCVVGTCTLLFTIERVFASIRFAAQCRFGGCDDRPSCLRLDV